MSPSQSIKNACTNLSRKIRVKRSNGMDPFGYEKICLLDSDVKKIDENFMHHTKSMFNIVTDGVGKSGFSLQCLKDWTAGFLEIDRAVVRVILSCKEDIWADNDLFEIVKCYLDISEATLLFCQVIHKYIKDAKTKLLLIQDAIESMPKHTQPTEDKCKRVMDNLNKFMNADNPFPEEFFRKLEDLLLRQMKVQQKFEEQKKRVGKKLKRVKGWKKISSIIWVATCAGALVATVVTAFLSVVGVPVDVGVIAGICVPSWLLSRCRLGNKAQRELQERLNRLGVIDRNTLVLIKEVGDIKMQVHSFVEDVKCVENSINFVRERGDACSIRVALESISEEHASLLKGIKQLEEYVDMCTSTIYEGRKFMLNSASNTDAHLPPSSMYKLSIYKDS